MDYSEINDACVNANPWRSLNSEPMTKPFKIVHSVLDSEALARACAEQYGFSEQPHCEFIHRGMNDVYRLHAGADQYALRAWRANWRSMADVAYELESERLDARLSP